MKTAKQMIDERLTIQEGELKGAQRTPTKADIEQLMLEYHAQFEIPEESPLRKFFDAVNDKHPDLTSEILNEIDNKTK